MNEDKLGHLTYKELQEQNKDFSYDDYRRYVANYHLNERLTQPLGWEEGTHIQSPIFQATEGEDYLGNSRYDQDVYREQDLDNIFDIRANNQSWLAQVGNGLAKGALTFGTTYFQGNIGLIMALLQGVENAMDNDEHTKFLHGFVENPYLELANAVSKWGEEVFPNYYSSKEINNDEEGKWWKNMASGNFIGDKILKNAGFTIGALYSSAGISSGLSSIAKVAGIAEKSATKAIIGGVTTTLMAASEASMDASNNMNDDYLVKGKQAVEARAATDKQAIYDKYAPIFNQIDAEYEANKANLVQYDKESGKFINPNYNKYLQQRALVEAQMQAELAGVDDASNAALQRLADTRLKVATEDFLNQFPTLLLSEGFQWGRMFANGFKTANRASHIISNGKLFGVAGTEKAANWLSQETKAMQRMRGIGKGIGRGLMEAHEEIGQKIDYELPKAYYMQDVMNFYAASMDPDAELETMSRMNAVRDGLRTTLQDPSTWEEGFLGFLPGAFGVPVFGKRFTSSNETWLGRNRAVGVTGGIGGAIRENKARLAQEKIVIDAVNKRVQEPDFVNYWQGLIRHEKYQKEMDLAVEENDKAKFEDANQAQMISDIVMFDNAGKLNDLIEFVSNITDESKENIASIVEQTTQSLEDNTKYQEERDALVSTISKKWEHINELDDEIDRLVSQVTEKGIQQPIFEYKYDPISGESIQSSRTITDKEISEKKKRINELHELREEEYKEFENLIQQRKNMDSDVRKSIGAFVDEYGNIDDEEYIAQKIKENRDDLIKTIKLYRDNKREIDSNSDNRLSNEQLATLTWLKTHTQKWEERTKSMENTLKKDFFPKAISFYQDLLSKDNITDKEKEDATHKLELLQSLQSSKDLANEFLGDKTNLLETLIIAQNPAITGTDLQDITSMLTDLPRIKILSTEYVNKFNEYMKNAEKLEQDMAKSREKTASIRSKRESKVLKKKVADIASKFNWNSSDDITQSFEAAKEEIDALGGEKVFADNLTKEQKVLFKQARKSNKFDASAVSGIEGSDLSNESKRKLVEAYDELDKSMDVNDKLNTLMENVDSILEKSNPDLIEDTPEQREFMVEEQTKAMKVLQEISDTIRDNKKSLEYVSSVEEKINKVAEDTEERPLNQPTDETPSEEPDVQEPDDLDYDFTDQRISRRQAKGYNGKSTQEFGHVQEPGSEPLLRPQISEYYLHTINKMQYSDYLDDYSKDSQARPVMLDGYTYEQYREYIGAIEKYLHEHGAFEYVKHHLKKGDKIDFIVEEIGGQEVVLMVTDNNQVIGSLPAEIDFHYYSKYPIEYDEQGNPTEWAQTEDTLRTRDRARYAQYESIITKYHEDKSNNIDTKNKVYGTSRVAELMGGMLSLNGASKNDSAESARAKTELTISDVFGDETPVIGIIGKDNKMFLSKPSIKDSVILPRGEQGQIYVMVPTNKGTYIPALVYSRLVNEVMDTAYTDAVVKKIQEVASADRTTSSKLRGELEKMLRVPTGQFKIQYYDKGAKAGQAGKVRQNPKGAAYIGIAVDKGNKGMFWIPVEDGKVNEDDAMKFIKELVHKYPDTSTGWDINQLTNPNYAAFMADYLVSNLNDPHSINDFFTYELDSEESRKEQIEKESKKEAAVQQETERKGHNVVIEVNDGEELSVNNEGIVKDKDGQVVPGVRLTTFKTGLDLDSSSKPTEGQEGEQKIGLKGLFQRPKNLEVTKETSSERMTTEKQLYEDVERLKKLFPSLSAPDRIVIRDSLIDSVDRNGNPVKAYGAFINGVLYISRQSPRGTSYHESFHYLIDNLLNSRDKNLLIHEAKSRYKTNDDLEAEDKLSETFRKFMNNITERGISGFMYRIFKRLKHLVNTITKNRDAIDILFWDIYMNRPHKTNSNAVDISAYHAQLINYVNRKYGYDRLDSETKDYLAQRGITKEHYEGMTYEQKEYLLHCM